MCVIHVSSNGKYRMTNAGNTNGSPVVDKETVLREYPALKGVLDKMYSEPLDDEERVVSTVRPFTVIELNDTTKGYTRKQIAMLIGNACRFGDDYFEWVYETLDGGDLESGDSLIRKYLATGANRPTEEQEERLVRDGWGEYVDYNLKQYTKQVSEFTKNVKRHLRLENGVYVYDRGYMLTLYEPLDHPVRASTIKLIGDFWTDESLSNFVCETGMLQMEVMHRVKHFKLNPKIDIISCMVQYTSIQSVTLIEGKSTFQHNKNLSSVKYEGQGDVDLSIEDSPKLTALNLGEQTKADLNLKEVGIRNFNDIHCKSGTIVLEQCDKLTSLDGIA